MANILDTQQSIASHYAHKIAELTDSVAYAYIVKQIDALKEKGEDPTQYEVIFVRDNFPGQTDDAMVITNHIRLVKIGRNR